MTDYDTEICLLQKEFDSLTAQANAAEQAGENSLEIHVQRGAVYEELTRLNRLKFEELHETIGHDDDYDY
jgi:hypothetical protein